MWPGSGYESGWLTGFDRNVAPTEANLASDPDYATRTSTPGSRENLPINCVNWYEAYAFCIWDGGFLPSEAEWEYAAAGGSEQREYPWGSAAPATANQYAIYGCYYNPDDAGLCTGVANIAPVGTATLGAGRWGQLDLAGDEYQWNLDSWSSCGCEKRIAAPPTLIDRRRRFARDETDDPGQRRRRCLRSSRPWSARSSTPFARAGTSS
jgi:sulfatase modifying factor 1